MTVTPLTFPDRRTLAIKIGPGLFRKEHTSGRGGIAANIAKPPELVKRPQY
jgi:hypothetical protein